jgi:peptidoglycan/xylan/chitin deacetylase (PgdA/CDA1 family)
MQRENMNNRRGHRCAIAATLLVVVVLVAAGCASTPLRGSTPLPTPWLPSEPVPTVPSPKPTAVPTQAPVVSLAPATATAIPSYPPVNSCSPASVPGAVPVSVASGEPSSFTLHVPILEYHRIVPYAEAGSSLRGLLVPPATFAAQLDALQRDGWHTITLAALANDLLAHKRPAAKTFAITIDDGWDDGYTYALPILAQHGFVATYFIIAARINRTGFLTGDQLRSIVAAGDEVGDHTMNHVQLTSQQPAKLTYEIDAAASRIAQVTGYWPESLAYPYGAADQQAADAVAACQELRIAVIEKPLGADGRRIATPVALETWTNHFDVPRVSVSSSTKPANLVAELASLAAG